MKTNKFFRSLPDAREFGCEVYLSEEPSTSFNQFWKKRLELLNRTGSR